RMEPSRSSDRRSGRDVQHEGLLLSFRAHETGTGAARRSAPFCRRALFRPRGLQPAHRRFGARVDRTKVSTRAGFAGDPEAIRRRMGLREDRSEGKPMRALLLAALLSIPLAAQVTSKSKPTTGVEPDPVYATSNRPRALALIGDVYHGPVMMRDGLITA